MRAPWTRLLPRCSAIVFDAAAAGIRAAQATGFGPQRRLRDTLSIHRPLELTERGRRILLKKVYLPVKNAGPCTTGVLLQSGLDIHQRRIGVSFGQRVRCSFEELLLSEGRRTGSKPGQYCERAQALNPHRGIYPDPFKCSIA